MKKNYTILIFILSILTTLLVAGLLVFFIKIIENKNQHISIITTTLEEKLKEKENVTIFAEKISEITLLQNSINGRFVDPNKIDSFVGYLEEIGLNIGSEVSVKNIEIPPKTPNTILFKLSITGTFQQVMNTVTLLENIPYKINITQVYLNKNIKQQEIQTQEEITQNKVPEVPIWQADVSFNILSL